MDKMWAGRFESKTDKMADDFNSSIHFDCKLYKYDIKGSMAHAAMLGAQNIISKKDSDMIIDELSDIYNDLENGTLQFDMECEDIHMFIEKVLTERIGDVGKRLHTARSRNDQVALDIRMYLKEQVNIIISLVQNLLKQIVCKAKENINTIMPGYTHLQRAQPVTFAHHILAYAMMLTRDIERLSDAYKRTNISPLGSCALAGTTYNTDRNMTAEKLGFDSVCLNSIDGVSDRDFCVEICADLSILMMHLSRFSEEIVLWSSWEFKFIELSDAYSTGSSIMPQKKNPDMAELVRGKCGRVYGNLVALLTTLKGLPLAYNKDMQEDKEAIFDSVETCIKCLEIFSPMISTMTVLKENMLLAAKKGFINATDLADYLVKKGMPFREAYKNVGQLVHKCISENKVLEQVTFEEYKQISQLFEKDVFSEISLEACVKKRNSYGGCSEQSINNQIEYVNKFILSNQLC